MEGRSKDYSARRKVRGRAGIIITLAVLVLVIGVAGFSLNRRESPESTKTNSEDLKTENRGCGNMELNPLRMDEYPEITSVVDKYYQSLGDKASFVEAYDNIKVYTKLGKYKDTYVAFARYEMKIKDIYTKVPGLGTVYVCKDKDGGYQVSAAVEEEDIKSYINEIAQHEDVQALIEETQTAYHEAVQSDALLQEALMDLKNAYEDSTGS